MMTETTNATANDGIRIVASIRRTITLAGVLFCLVLNGISMQRASASFTPNNERVLITIEGMSCTSCANGIKAMLKRTPGVVSAEVSYERREADVEYDPSRTSPEKIVEAITNIGYKASVKEKREA